MKIISAEFVKSALNFSQYPKMQLPEIAFIGRSNVGKSSLINTLVNRKGLAKTSAIPGKTQMLNFFQINRSLLFVDFPGYGYAKVPFEIKRGWKGMIETYLQKRDQLAGVVHLVDFRHPPSPDDQGVRDWLRVRNISSIVVATKSDKVAKSQRKSQQEMIMRILELGEASLIIFSVKNGEGKRDLWNAIRAVVERKGAPFEKLGNVQEEIS
ncbi:MAG: YihA family ribosome biogenesis GTP-binding protein [Candidatus Tectomicrobia bacterium]|nr:YihA family ribosome biogenesis GTP-binding protein [Candidatus Tectomicrobia bacterium]